MLYLFSVSFLWALSFGLVKDQLSSADPVAISVLRLGLAFLVFLPFVRTRHLERATIFRLAAIGAVQFGFMYLLYLMSFRYLKAFEIALFTVFTPLYVVIIAAIMEGGWHSRYLFAAILAAAGAGIVLDYSTFGDNHLIGFLLIQGSNFCFAAGQLAWRREHRLVKGLATDAQLFAIPYAGALFVCVMASLFTTDWLTFRLSTTQVMSVAYLGIVASGLAFFWWNVGAGQVNAGTLAVMNNAKMPLAVVCSIVIFHEQTNIPRLLVGGAAMGVGVWLAETTRSRSGDKAA